MGVLYLNPISACILFTPNRYYKNKLFFYNMWFKKKR